MINPGTTPGSGLTRKRPGLPLLASLPSRELSALLTRSGGSPSQAASAAAKVLRHTFRVRPEGLDSPWDQALLRDLGVGAWAHPALLALDARCSLTIAERAPALDGSERLLLATLDGNYVETVLIPAPNRTTVCVSSQVGCARACSFCETGVNGLTRQLDAGEIVDQLRIARLVWGNRLPAIQNVVFMGMGEPFDNLTEVAKATQLLTDDNAFALSRSRVTVSTVGVADKIGPFFESCKAELAVSLNAATDEKRGRIMPINQRFPLQALFTELEQHLPRGRRVLFEYVLIGGFNDSPEDARELAKLAARVRSRVNVIPMNPGPDPALSTPSKSSLDEFVAILVELGVTTLIRRPRGRDVGGACGQLAALRRSR
jgi:23S rRNA (adenine2503-C2)-methyltransferase